MVKCCIVGCRSSSKHSLTSGVRLHRFPTKNQSLRRKWIKFVLLAGTKISRLDISDRNNTRICSEHFVSQNRDENPVPSVLPDGRQLADDLPAGSSEANFMSELEMEDLEDKGATYEFEQDADMSLDDFIDCKLAELDLLSLIDKATDNLDIKLRQQERKTREVNQIFSHCESQMKMFRFNIEQSQGIDRSESPAPGGGSDSDDDVQFVQAGFDPQLASRFQHQRPPLPNQRMGIPAGMQQNFRMRAGMMVQKGQYPQASAGFARPFSPQPGMPGLRQLRPRLPSPRFPGPGQLGMRHQVGPQKALQDGGMRGPGPQEGVVSMQPRRPHTTMYAPQTKHADLVVGMKLYGQKFNDIWYKGTLTEIHNKEKPRIEWRYRIKFDGKGMKVLPGKQVAFADTPTDTLPVGSRVVALYKDEEASANTAHYAGIVAESPSLRNNQRYLIFFDDGYAQYCSSKEIHKVYEQSRNVWEDIHPDSQEFIKSYLKQYPERPMVRLQEGQIIKTEWNGRWWTARVLVADASLVKMYFDADKRVEWIYRGSTRLEPLYTELANAEMFKAGKGHRRHNIGGIKGSKKPIVEYVRGTDEDYMKRKQPNQYTKNRAFDTQGLHRSHSAEGLSGPKKRPVARKSVSKQQPQFAPGDVIERRHHFQASSISRNNVVARDLASVLQDRLAGEYSEYGESGALGERMEIDRGLNVILHKPYQKHKCSAKCLEGTERDPTKFRGNNPLIIPMLCGWERQISRQKNTGKRAVFYRAPCARRMRSLDDVVRYLRETDSENTVDYFCYDVNLHTHSEFVPIKTFCDIKDLSYGKETVQISCVNGIDRQYPDYVEYSNQRIPAEGVHLNLDTDFLVGCNCKDGECGDPRKCSCARLTYEASKSVSIFHRPEILGYKHRRLLEPIPSGIYECNHRCKCDHRCRNRVAQNGLQLRLQVFKTEKRGWGLRSLDDIPAGGFICVYAGQLLTEQGANEDGQQYGDEYLAELDYIEVVERCKEGYESDVDINLDDEEDEEGGNQTQSEPKSDSEADPYHDSDSTFSGEKYVARGNPGGTPKRESSRRRKEKEEAKAAEAAEGKPAKLVIKRGADQEKTWSVKVKSPQAKTKEWVDSIPDPMMIVISDEEDGSKGLKEEGGKEKAEGENGKGQQSDKDGEKVKEEETKKTKKKDQEVGKDEKEKDEKKDLEKEEEEKKDEEKEEKGVGKRDSDLDSMGEQKLDKPHAPSLSKVTLKLKSKVFSTGDVTIDPESKTDKDSDKNSETDEPSSSKSTTNKEEAKKAENADSSESNDGSLKKNSQKMTRSKSRDKKSAAEGSTKDETDNGSDKTNKQTRQSRFSGLPDPKSQQVISPLKMNLAQEEETAEKVVEQPKKKEKKKEPAPASSPEEEDNQFNTRLFYNNEDFCYVMDAKSIGNIGRYLNHSCGPNVFVQNVFVDTHDLRFPWVAFFAGQYIRAGTELTWDYNYEVGSVPGKILYCYCGAAECRGRLL